MSEIIEFFKQKLSIAASDYSQVNINNHELLMRDISKSPVNINNQLN